ncbi:MAG TPA: YkvA family protein [Chthoniobacterales bacterium]|nr:YkvA family protein [Chthoniobacterales bacterium]
MNRKRTVLPKKLKRNHVFAKVLDLAKSYASDPKALRQLVQEATRKAKSIPKAPFAQLWGYLQAMLRLIRAYYRGEYRNVRFANLVLIIGAIIYVLDPLDLIPDWIPGLGFLDDATILAFAVQKTRETLDAFTSWEARSL